MQHFRWLLMKIMETGSQRLRCETSTLFLNDSKTDELWSVVIQDSGLAEIRPPNNKGIAGGCPVGEQPVRHRAGETIGGNEALNKPGLFPAMASRAPPRSPSELASKWAVSSSC